MKKILTLCLIHRQPKILLGLKKRGFGAGRWNGFGGKLAPNETVEEAAVREMREEANLEIRKMEKVGMIDFEFQGNPELLEVHIFRVDDFDGEPAESEEMRPQWFDANKIPFAEMWPDDVFWIPLFLSGKKFTGRFLFKDSNIILEHQLIEVESV